MRYQPNVSSGVATMTVRAAAITKKPSVTCQDQSAERPVQSKSHHRAAYDGVDIPLWSRRGAKAAANHSMVAINERALMNRRFGPTVHEGGPCARFTCNDDGLCRMLFFSDD